MRGISLKRDECPAFEKTPRMSLGCKLIPVQYREYEYRLLRYCIVASSRAVIEKENKISFLLKTALPLTALLQRRNLSAK